MNVASPKFTYPFIIAWVCAISVALFVSAMIEGFKYVPFTIDSSSFFGYYIGAVVIGGVGL